MIEGVPGLAKTLMVKTLSDCLDSDFVILQFTSDLLPADIIGTKIYDHINSSFSTVKGPIFTNFILADEINRAPPKVQSALLEAMQQNIEFSQEDNTTNIQLQYSNEDNSTAVITAQIINNTVDTVELHKEDDSMVPLWFWLLRK